MKLEVGMYVRSKINGTIGKITDIENIEVLNEKREVLIGGETRYILDNNYNRGFCESENDSVIASYNIKGLIEVGDIIIDDFTLQPKKVSKISLNEDYIYCNCDMEKISPECIKSIVTKEQFESMSYKVGE